MFKSYAKILASIASSTMLLSIGATSAADLRSDESIDSRPAKEFVQKQDRAQYRREEQVRSQMDSVSGGEPKARSRDQAQSMEQERRKPQARSQQRLHLPDSGGKGMAMGGGRR